MTPEGARATAPLTWAEIDDWRRYQADARVVAALDAGEQMAAALEKMPHPLECAKWAYNEDYTPGPCTCGRDVTLAAWRQAVAPR